MRGRERGEPSIDLAGDGEGDVLSGGVEVGEGFDGVEVVVDPGGEDGAQDVLEGVEIDDQAIGIEARGGHGEGHAEVVAVHRLERARDADGVSGTELMFNAEIKHEGVYEGWGKVCGRSGLAGGGGGESEPEPNIERERPGGFSDGG